MYIEKSTRLKLERVVCEVILRGFKDYEIEGLFQGNPEYFSQLIAKGVVDEIEQGFEIKRKSP